MDSRVLVSGATGLIGRRMVASLCADGVAVRALTRNVEAASRALGPEVDIREWDGVQLSEDALAGCSSVVHLAGEPVFAGRLTAARRNRILASRVDSTRSITRALADVAVADRPSAFICASAVGIYGSRGEELLDESARAGSGFLAEVCREWEAAAVAAEKSGLRVVSLRIGVVLDRSGGALPLMALPFRLGVGGRTGSGQQWVPWIHGADVVALIRAVLRDDGFCGPINAVAPEPLRNRDLARALGRALRRPALVPLPAFALRVALGELSDELLGSRRCIPQRALDRGFDFTHRTIETALAAELT